MLGAAFRWRRPPDAESKRHLTAWFERVEQYRRGVEARPSNERAVGTASGDRRVLVIGASAMGNVGDDLLAAVLTEMLAAEGADVHLAGPDIDPLRVAAYDAVVVGGGGLVYASRNGQNETQNIANYLKFGPIARRCGVPAALIGVGDQDHAGGIERNPLTKRFVAAALAQFGHVTARDAQSGDFLARHGAVGPKVGSDLLFRWRERARGAVKPTAVQPGRVAFAGELFRFRTIADGFANGGPLAACAEDADIDVLVMSDDDVEHAQRMQQVLTKAGASAAVVDLRGRDFAALVFLFASYSAVVTTRFHGLVIAALAEVPVLALDVQDGKCARLLRSVDAARSLVIDGDGDGLRRIEEALAGGLEPLPAADARRARAPNGRAREHSARIARSRGSNRIQRLGAGAEACAFSVAGTKPDPALLGGFFGRNERFCESRRFAERRHGGCTVGAPRAPYVVRRSRDEARRRRQHRSRDQARHCSRLGCGRLDPRGRARGARAADALRRARDARADQRTALPRLRHSGAGRLR